LARAAGRSENELLDFSANLNPLGPPEWLRAAISAHVSSLRHYPDPDCTELIAAAAKHYRVEPDEVIAGNGSTEILYLLPTVLKKSRAVIPVPSYADYARAASQAGMQIQTVSLEEELLAGPLTPETAVFIGRPNNPTGQVYEAEALRGLARKYADTAFVIDEAFGDFVEDFDSLTRRRPGNVVVLLSLTKIFATPGLRLGCAVAEPSVIRRLRERQAPWSVNTLAQAVGTAALADAEFLARTRAYVREQREALASSLQAFPALTVYPAEANFLLVRLDAARLTFAGVPDGVLHSGNPEHSPATVGAMSPSAAPAVAGILAELLLQQGIAIRVCDNFAGLDGRYFRVAVRTAEENARLVAALDNVLNSQPAHPAVPPVPLCPSVTAPAKRIGRPRAAAIMFQGTSSNAGKSVLTAALCRILQQDGLRVAPFKSQNMSLNSFVTREGGEMGRAQVVQAQACRMEPDVRMNPILLKPSSQVGAQVILMGKPAGNMSVGEYVRFKPQAFAAAKRAFDELAAENDVIVLEGAGSPGEVNLKHHDIANMAMARHAAAPVLLVGDIDRGGVFASFVGTMEVLAEWERELIAGFVVNRFRGQASLLDDAFTYTQRHTGRPVLGVVPYLPDLGLPEEDSVSFKAARSEAAANGPDGAGVDIAILDLPYISNFTDFDALRVEPDVQVRIVRTPEELGRPDAAILPGSKSVAADLAHLRRSGLAAAIGDLVAEGRTEIVGVCGGYQMLGSQIEDPHGIESGDRIIQGLGCLPLATTMAEEKTLKRAAARHVVSGLAVEGYEIHHGQSTMAGPAQPLVIRDDGEAIGVTAPNQMVWGTYLHGIFDSDAFRRWFVDRLRVRRNLPAIGRVVAAYDLHQSFDRLAAVVRQSLDMDRIYRLLQPRSCVCAAARTMLTIPIRPSDLPMDSSWPKMR
jgi:cobyric acid synthase CobQ/L-threonine-O-3-phosphate decarboxylase